MSSFCIDSNLLVLLIVGNVGREYIAKHRRLTAYSARDSDILVENFVDGKTVVVTPNTLTEASNLLAQHGEPERSMFLNELRSVIEDSDEIYVESTKATNSDEYESLGLADSALLNASTPARPLVTVDFELWQAALTNGIQDAVNFTHYRELW